VKKALILVHISSLDSYTAQAKENDFRGDARGFDLADNFSYDITNALQHDESVFIIDQAWEVGHRESRPRESLLEDLDGLPITWILFADDDDPDMIDSDMLKRFPYQRIAQDGNWKAFLPNLTRLLRKQGITHVRVGGIWFTEDLTEGCATAVYKQLRKHFKTEVGTVGTESDFVTEEEDD